MRPGSSASRPARSGRRCRRRAARSCSPAPPTPSRCCNPVRWCTTRTLPSRSSARSSPGHTGRRRSRLCRIGSSTRSDCRGQHQSRHPAARRLLRRALLGRVAAGARPRSRRLRALGKLSSTTRDLARWALPRDGRRPRARRQRRWRRCRRPGDRRPRARGRSGGDRPRALSLRRAPLRRPRRLHAGPSRWSRRQSKTKVGASVLTNTAQAPARRSSRSISRSPAIECCRPATDAWQPGEKPPVRARPILGRWWTEGHRDRHLLAQGAARGAPRRRPPARTCVSRTGR